MNDVEALNRNKEGILSSLRARGPSIPVQVAKVINTTPLFASAFLSELKDEKKVNVSHMRMGSSPIYYLPGQEAQLANFSEYLNQREREAFMLLKQEGVLEDDAQTPVVRVALRAIKDFAIPLNVRVDGETKTFWKYFTLSNSEASESISTLVNGPSQKEDVSQKESETQNQEGAGKDARDDEQKDDVKNVAEEEKTEEVKADKKEEIKEEEKKEVPQEKEEKKVKNIFDETTKEHKKPKTTESEFSKIVKEYLEGNNFEVFEILAEKKKEFVAKIRAKDPFGPQDYYLIAKDKKNVTDNDLVVASQKAQSEKMPAAVMSNGNLNKKAQKHLEEWGNLVKFSKIE